MDYTNDIREVIEKFQFRVSQASGLIESGKYDEAILELEKIQREAWQYNIPQISTFVENTLNDAKLFKNLVKMFKVSSRLKIDDICGHFKLTRMEILEIFFERGEKWGVNIDGDFISMKNKEDEYYQYLKHQSRLETDSDIVRAEKQTEPSANSLMLRKYKMYISLGDNAFESKDYKKALDQYNKAINIAENELFDPDLVLRAENFFKKSLKFYNSRFESDLDEEDELDFDEEDELDFDEEDELDLDEEDELDFDEEDELDLDEEDELDFDEEDEEDLDEEDELDFD